MSKEYDAFVENLRQLLLERLGLKEEQIFFKEQDEQGMTPSGDRLFVECHASPAGKEVCGIHTEELFDDYEDGVSGKNCRHSGKRNPQTEKCRIF